MRYHVLVTAESQQAPLVVASTCPQPATVLEPVKDAARRLRR